MAQVVRFGVGWPTGLQSSTYRVWAEKDSSVYIVPRPIAQSFKISLHPNEYGYGYTEVYEKRHGKVDGGRKIAVWKSEENRLGDLPLREAYAVLLGRFSLGLHPPPATDDEVSKRDKWLRDVEWVQEIPPVDHAWQFTVLISDPGIRSTAPGTRSMGAIPVGKIDLPNGGNAWVMRHLVPVSESMMETLKRVSYKMPDLIENSEEHAVFGAQVHFNSETGLRASVDLKATFKAPPALMRAANQQAGMDAERA